MSQLYKTALNIPKLIRDNETVRAGLSSWVHRLDAVTKCYTADDNKERDREVAIFEHLCSDDIYLQRAILRYYSVLNGCVILQFAQHSTIRQYVQSQTYKPSLSV